MYWLFSDPIYIGDLKGKVILLRWWTDDCPYCRESAPAINEWHYTYRDSGLVVIALYHEKPL